MLDFGRRTKSPEHLSRGQQFRLLAMVMLLGLVVVLTLGSRDSELFEWFGSAGEGGGNGSNSPGVVSRAVQPPTDGGRRLFPGVNEAYLGDVEDDKPFVSGEKDAWFHLFEILEQTDAKALEEASSGRVSYIQLQEQSNEFRGELVTVRGTLCRAHQIPAPRNEYGIKQYYQTWLQPADNRRAPIVVYCLYLPEEFPTGMEISEQVEITGFFFKRWAYAAKEDILTAPVLLARTVRWYPASEPVRESPDESLSLASLLLVVGGAAFCAVLAATLVYFRTQRGKPSAEELVVSIPRPSERDAESDVVRFAEPGSEGDKPGES